MYILNGRTIGDIIGDITCIKWNGVSTVDYSIASPELCELTQYFKVKPFTIFSDHKPIETAILIEGPSDQEYFSSKTHRAPKRFKITDSGKSCFAQLQNNADFEALLNEFAAKDHSNCESMNKDLTSILIKVSDKAFDSTKPWKEPTNGAGKSNHKPWYDQDCLDSKRSLNKCLRGVNKLPESDYLRKNFYMRKKKYYRLLKTKKHSFFSDLNAKIEDGHLIDWTALKKLKTARTNNTTQFDGSDREKFKVFFEKLYSGDSNTLSKSERDEYYTDALITNTNGSADDNLQNDDDTELLNCSITMDELNKCIKSLKTGKSASDDIISNDILKLLSTNSKKCLLRLFNKCFDDGVYPWHNSIITPLHKKGNKQDPNNYRAIALGSAIGKLLSSILLDRIIKFKKLFHPDPPNQAGFTKGSQTIDHILTTRTIIEKYKKMKKKTYCVFVDLKKAFDSIPREALLLKLAKIGLTGKIFNIIHNMYQGSTSQLKMDRILTEKFPVERGTEQGHTLSPELFKSYVIDLSVLLDEVIANVPYLKECKISHLLFADDLVLIALDLKSAQKLMDVFYEFCNKWGLEINRDKTNLVIFNKKSLKNNMEFITVDNKPIETVDSYCYLGLKLHMSGSMTPAVDNLRLKGLRAMFALRSYVDKEVITARSLLNLFDLLIKPILTYGSPIWTPHQLSTKTLIKTLLDSNVSDYSKLHKDISANPAESVHLKHLKWILGVHKRASNIGCWGDLGRLTIINSSITLTMSYVNRLEELDDVNSFVKMAYEVQKSMNLEWYSNVTKLQQALNSSSTSNSTDGQAQHAACKTPLKSIFTLLWNQQVMAQGKLRLYSQLKQTFGLNLDPYLTNVSSYEHRATIAKLRISAHQLGIETGRYRNIPRGDRICTLCDTGAIDDEDHLLFHCPSLDEEHTKIGCIIGYNDIDAKSYFNVFSASYDDLPNSQAVSLFIGLNRLAKLTSTAYKTKLKLLELRKKKETDKEKQ